MNALEHRPMIDLVLLGAGHAHVEVLRRFARRPEPGLRLTLISRSPVTPYSGRLPALIRGDCGPEDTEIDLGPLAAAAAARLVIGEATGIELAGRVITVEGRPTVRFDLLAIDVGGMPAIPSDGGIAVKPIGQFLATLTRMETELAEGARLALVGGGAAGTELALALARRFGGRFRLTLVCETPEPLAEAPPSARAAVRTALAEAGVELVCGVRAGAHAAGRLALSDGSVIEAAQVMWATQATGPALLAESGLICDAAGCVIVASSLRSKGHDFVFAAGDCASVEGAPRPKAGVWAVRAGPVLAANLRRAAQGERPRAWRPQADALAILGLGQGRAVAWRNGFAVSGRLVGWYKDWIDQRFLKRYAIDGLPHPKSVPEPDRVELDAADLGVISNTALHQAQAGLAPPAGARLVQRASHLLAPLDDPFTFGRIAASHALTALHASGAQPWSAAAIVTPAAGTGEAARADVLAMLQGAAEVLEVDGARLADCTTAFGTAASISLMLTGVAVPAHPVETLQPGDCLILTKPLGSGVLLHGSRLGYVAARSLLAAVETTVASSAMAARILHAHGATACAAVAGHGAIGALMEMLRTANLAVGIVPEAIPALPGALALLRRGIAHPRAVENVRVWSDAPDRPEVALLMDPQIAGGLLAGVQSGRAAACLAALRAAGYDAAIIGEAEARRLELPRLRLLENVEGS
jgi:selenide, water dikinase